MTVRRYAAIVFLLVGLGPLALSGLLILRRAERTALADVRDGNRRIAVRAASRLAAFVDSEVAILRTLGASLAPAVGPTPSQLEFIMTGYRVSFPHLRELDVVKPGSGCRELATSRADGVLRERCGEPAVAAALGGSVYLGPVALSSDFAPLMTIGVPLDVAGDRVGAAIAVVDMVGIWDAVNEVRVGATGFARLVTAEGTLIAHGDPEERRRVFLHERDPRADIVRANASGALYADSQGREVLAVAAGVPGLDWTVIVEQPVAEAFLAAREMRRDLLVVMLATAILAIVGTYLGARRPLRALEAMRDHVREIGRGRLDARLELPRLAELRALAQALNEMPAELDRLQKEVRSRDRLQTFARVAAGLGHDLKGPIEELQVAWNRVLKEPQGEPAQAILRRAAEVQLPRLRRYVSDLGRLAREGRIPLERRWLGARQIVDRVVGRASENPSWGGVEFVAEGEDARVYADESLLERALGNLVANAGDVCLNGDEPGRVRVRVEPAGDDGAVVFSIIDNGPGLSAERLDEVLSNDFRSSKHSGGVGLGLGVARHVAVSHGGSLTAESQPGAGCTFRIVLPRGGEERGEGS